MRGNNPKWWIATIAQNAVNSLLWLKLEATWPIYNMLYIGKCVLNEFLERQKLKVILIYSELKSFVVFRFCLHLVSLSIDFCRYLIILAILHFLLVSSVFYIANINISIVNTQSTCPTVCTWSIIGYNAYTAVRAFSYFSYNHFALKWSKVFFLNNLFITTIIVLNSTKVSLKSVQAAS